MQLWLIFIALLVNYATSSVDAVECAGICYTKDLTGFGPGGTPGCTCSGSEQGARTGAGSCSCGQCYEKAQGVVYGFAVNADGTCTYGKDCGTCNYLTSSSTGASDTAAPATFAPSLATSAPSLAMSAPSLATSMPSQATSAPSPATSSPASGTSPAPVISAPPSVPDSPSPITTLNNTSPFTDTTYSTSEDGIRYNTGTNGSSEERGNTLNTWQIVLAVCCAVVIFVVAFVAVCTCYCKARRRLYEHEDDHTSYYTHYAQTSQPWASNNATTRQIISKRVSVAI